MPQRRKHVRRPVRVPVLCKIRNRKNEIVISAVGKTNNLSLGGMNVSLPVHLLKLNSRLVEYTAELPEPFSPMAGKGVIRWGFWDEKNWQTTFGMELCWLDDNQVAELEDFLRNLDDPSEAPFFSTLNN